MTDPSAANGGSRVILLTRPGPAAIAVVQLSGPAAHVFSQRHLRTLGSSSAGSVALGPLRAGSVRRAVLVEQGGEPLDDLVISVGADPTTIWLHLHGSVGVVGRVTELAKACGAAVVDPLSPGSPGQTLWRELAFLEQEAADLLPSILTLRGVEWVLSQPAKIERLLKAELQRDERLAAADRMRLVSWFTQPLRAVLVGAPNVGKSTLLNALAERDVSLTTPEAGTTRDWVSVVREHDGFPIEWIDTAGLHTPLDVLDAAAIVATRKLIGEVDVIVCLVDITRLKETMAALGTLPRVDVLVVNKVDLVSDTHGIAGEVDRILERAAAGRAVGLSAAHGTALDALRVAVLESGKRDARELDHPAAITPAMASLLRAEAQAEGRPLVRDP